MCISICIKHIHVDMYQIPELSWRIPASWFESLLYFIALTPKFLQLQVERQHCQTKKASLTDCWKRLRCQWTPRWIESSIGARRFLIVPRYLGTHSSNPNPLASLSVSFSCFPMFSSVVCSFCFISFSTFDPDSPYVDERNLLNFKLCI